MTNREAMVFVWSLAGVVGAVEFLVVESTWLGRFCFAFLVGLGVVATLKWLALDENSDS